MRCVRDEWESLSHEPLAQGLASGKADQPPRLQDVIRVDWIRFFNPVELQVLISGEKNGDFDVDDLKAHTIYSGGCGLLLVTPTAISAFGCRRYSNHDCVCHLFVVVASICRGSRERVAASGAHVALHRAGCTARQVSAQIDAVGVRTKRGGGVTRQPGMQVL